MLVNMVQENDEVMEWYRAVYGHVLVPYCIRKCIVAVLQTIELVLRHCFSEIFPHVHVLVQSIIHIVFNFYKFTFKVMYHLKHLKYILQASSGVLLQVCLNVMISFYSRIFQG